MKIRETDAPLALSATALRVWSLCSDERRESKGKAALGTARYGKPLVVMKGTYQ